jgi:hypothetical protein
LKTGQLELFLDGRTIGMFQGVVPQAGHTLDVVDDKRRESFVVKMITYQATKLRGSLDGLGDGPTDANESLPLYTVHARVFLERP